MNITVQLEAQLRHAAGVSHAAVSMPDNSSVVDVLQVMASRFGPTLGERLIAADGTAQRSVLLFLNDKPVAHATVAEHQLHEGDVLLLYPPISGG